MKAERSLRSGLIPKGIGLHTGELDLSYRLLSTWASCSPLASFAEREPVLPAQVSASSFPALFPEIVQLTEVLTNPDFVTYLLSPQRGSIDQTKLLLSTAAGIAQMEAPFEVVKLARTVIVHGRDAVAAAYGMTGTRRTSRAATLDRALVAAARTHRACLLRHLDTRALPSVVAVPRGRPAPRTKTFAAVEYEADPSPAPSLESSR
ncbi:hypothetical protein [Luethyella okanaganae]|uniref:Uncharacterized protein n=1 Tax=Luethyella okanaganae TaxID=69372 RepID=A0ABW1VGC3_9MICO